MKKAEFMERMAMAAVHLPEQERNSLMEYFEEIICDRKEDGEEEERIIASLGAPEDIVRTLQNEGMGTREGTDRIGTIPPEPDYTNAGQQEQGSTQYTAKGQVHTIRVRAENRAVEVFATDRDRVSVEFSPVKGIDEAELCEEGGEYIFRHRMKMNPIAGFLNLLRNGAAGRTIILHIPRSFDGRVAIEDGNSSIQIRGVLGIAELDAETSNSSIVCLDTQVEGETKLRTGNSSVVVSRWEGGELTVKTGNGKIRLEQIHGAGRVSAKTSNSSVEVNGVDAPDIKLKTSNGKIIGSVAGDLAQYDIVSKTGNASNNLPREYRGTGERRLQAETSNGKIQIAFEGANMR